MESIIANSKDSITRHSNSENDVYEDYNNGTIYNEIQDFDFLQESILENQNIHNQNIENHLEILPLSTFLLPTEQALQELSHVSQDHEDTILHCIEDHSDVAIKMNLDQLYHVNLDSILTEMTYNDSKDATKSLKDLNLIDNTNIGISFQEITQHTPSRPYSQQKLKRTIHTRNPLYITNSLNKSLFNEGPTIKKRKTPLFNSPTSTSHQSLANTRAPSPLKTHEQSPQETPTSTPLETYATSFLPIPHEFQFNHINESISATNQNEDVININNMPLSFENFENFNGNEDIDITDFSLDTPILDDYNIGDNINTHDVILQFDIPNEFPSDPNTNFVDVSNIEIKNDMSLNFEVPKEFPSMEKFDLLDISNLVDSNAENLNNQCTNTSHTISPLLFIEQITQLANIEDMIHTNDESNLEKDPNEMALKAIDDNNTNFEACLQKSNEASILINNAKNVNVKSVYILNKDKTTLVSADLISHDTQELVGKMSEKTNELQEETCLEMMKDAIDEPIEELNEETKQLDCQESFVEMMEDTTEESNEEPNELYCQESFVEMMEDATEEPNEEPNELYCQESFVEMMKDNFEEPNEELNEIQREPLVTSMHSNTQYKQVKNYNVRSDQFRGVYKATGGWAATLPKLGVKNEYWKIGLYATSEVAARVQDLLALKLEMHLKIKIFYFHFPLADYKDDFEEMKKWSNDDYIWSMKRQSIGFTHGESGLKCVHRSRRKNPSGGEMWVGKVANNQVGNKTIKGLQKVLVVDHNPNKEILGIFTDLVNLHLSGWDYVTNFRRGHYTIDDVQKFVLLLEEEKVSEAYAWDLIKQVLNEPLPFSIHLQSSQKIIDEKCTRESLVAKLNPKDMAKHFIECPWIQIDESWALYKKPSNDCDLEFEDTIIHMFKASNWSPSNIKLYSVERKKYKFYFPCVIATNFAEVNLQRRILGLDYYQYLINTHDTCTKEYYQKQWVNLPNIRYLELDFYNVIACDGGLIAVKRERNEQNLSDEDNNNSTIIITNPLTYDIKFLPPIPYKLLHHKIARLVFYDSTRTTYRLIIIGAPHCEETIHDDDIQIIESTQISLVVYCSIKESWVHFEQILNAAPPSVKLGYSNIVVNGCSIYYGGLQISSQKKRRRLKPVIFYFNLNNSRRQQLIIDFTKAGDIYFIKVVEPPKLVQIGFNTKIYAVSRQAQFKKRPDLLFIIEVDVNEDGTPTGLYKILTQGIMPIDLYTLLFKKRGVVKMAPDEKLPPWEVMASVEHIAIKVIGFDPLIALYNVKDQKWNYTYFPYIEPIQKLSNTKTWRLIPGVYEPRWNATP